MKVQNDEGVEMDVFTTDEMTARETAIKAEYEAKLLDKDAHVQKKLDEFQQGKTAQELKDAERDTKIEEARKLAEDATLRATTAEERRLAALKDIAMKRYVGDDAELKAKFEESWNIVNLEIKDDSDVVRKAELVANMAGINQSAIGLGNMPMGAGGGFAPKVSAVEKEKKEAEYSKFKSQLGLEDLNQTQS